jgi:hypothetical protein
VCGGPRLHRPHPGTMPKYLPPSIHTLSLPLSILGIFLCVCLFCLPGDCSGKGVCHGTVCSCNTYYEGDDCSIYDEVLVASIPAQNTVDMAAWKYVFGLAVQWYRKVLVTLLVSDITMSTSRRQPASSGGSIEHLMVIAICIFARDPFPIAPTF